MSARRPFSKWALLALLFVTLVAIDQWTKYLAVERLTTLFERTGAETLGERLAGFLEHQHLEPISTDPYYVWRPVWRMNYVENPGAAWGLFRGHSEAFRNGFFTLVSLGAVAFILHYYRKLRAEQRYLQVALALVLSGAVGNFLDRLARGYVIDFIEWYWWNRPDIRWPTFNIADSLIVVGVALLVLHPGSGKAAQKAGADAEGDRRASTGG
ncbi:signal peptidase II [Anaeromyxobacter sp. Fw109-5]|uniref:Lipoprotein signal peptidase n=1 Tax=Anaeromyxobacter sp. (strain Fw109-5) TaxID=404589 RepID=LSPA_ANADF|nr:signal peptidase II [Anaeromyxobacter sp. Fw109-5]A7H688.1 RecName: Full=Lipoprotein signal peptidase; AltName: Full=Prolipoprotein signal peptidase; AltName: Full=Signal peptidase II; Short=SPase II [Anaeromyxobacter sp. Fw109-5]ABS24234.1 lipoprotein signal peptidase [Anaeromyxobacter sp. Fw109-5]